MHVAGSVIVLVTGVSCTLYWTMFVSSISPCFREIRPECPFDGWKLIKLHCDHKTTWSFREADSVGSTTTWGAAFAEASARRMIHLQWVKFLIRIKG